MQVFTVSLFGHRAIEDLRRLNDGLVSVVKELIEARPYVTFLIGRNGEFDEYAASVIKSAQKSTEKENSDITLVLPYTVADLAYYKEYYDSIIIPERMGGVHPKAAITVRNRWMVEISDLVIVYLERRAGGAYAAMRYAERLNKNIINLCARETDD